MKSFNGKILKIDLTTGEQDAIKLSDEVCKKYLGGRSLGAKLLVDYVPEGVDPMEPECPFFLLTGPTTGTIVPSSGKYVIVGKSPLTGAFLDSYSSGYIAAELKYAGWDGLMITGCASHPCYLYIKDDVVEIRDASHIWGKDAFESEDLIRTETNPRAGVAVIGVAGERKVRIAIVNSEHYRQAARGGTGALFGSKNLKGIAVLGTKGLDIADMPSVMSLYKEIVETSETSVSAQGRKKYGTPLTLDITNNANMLPTNNFQEVFLEDANGKLDSIGCERMVVKSRACWGCMMACSKVSKADDSDLYYKDTIVEGPEYETTVFLGTDIGITNLSSVIDSNRLCDYYGIDTIAAGSIIAFVMECVQHGYLTEEEVGIKDVRFGNDRIVAELLRLMGTREGFGDIMAEGTYRLAQYVGKDSLRFAMQVKKMDFPGYDPRAGYGVGLSYAVNPRGACHRKAWPPALEVLKGFPPYTTENKGKLIRDLTAENNVLHSVLVCDFPSKYVPFSAYEIYSKFLTYLTGVEWRTEELLDGADRGEDLARLFNYREGFSREDDTLPDRVFDDLAPMRKNVPDGPPISREALEIMKDDYYRERGWDCGGCPTEESLKRLGMEEYMPLAQRFSSKK